MTFNEHMGYREAMLRGRAQDKAILNMLADNEVSATNLEDQTYLKTLLDKVKKETNNILDDDNVAKTMHH